MKPDAPITESKRQRRAREAMGRRAERLASIWLICKGYRILDRRARTPKGEIDLVAQRGNILAFVEVKARSAHRQALEAVTPTSQRRIEQAAQLWSARHADAAQKNWRYDIITVTPGKLPQHLRDAWRPERD